MLKKICNILSAIIFIILFIIAAVLIVPNFLGYKSYAVISGSMEPNIHVGSIVFANEVDFNELKVDDIVTYRLQSNSMVTHRIESIDSENKTIVTKGDANNENDGAPISSDRIQGRVDLTIPLLGYISVYIKTPLGIAGVCGVVAILIIINYLPEVIEKKE